MPKIVNFKIIAVLCLLLFVVSGYSVYVTDKLGGAKSKIVVLENTLVREKKNADLMRSRTKEANKKLKEMTATRDVAVIAYRRKVDKLYRNSRRLRNVSIQKPGLVGFHANNAFIDVMRNVNKATRDFYGTGSGASYETTASKNNRKIITVLTPEVTIKMNEEALNTSMPYVYFCMDDKSYLDVAKWLSDIERYIEELHSYSTYYYKLSIKDKEKKE